jgi:hypothetical protein
MIACKGLDYSQTDVSGRFTCLVASRILGVRRNGLLNKESAMTPLRITMALAMPLLACATTASADPFDALPARNPQALEQLANLDNAGFSRLVTENSGAAFRQIVDPYDPGAVPIFPVSHGFAGARRSCLQSQNVEACRLYTVDLLSVQQEKQNRGAVPDVPPGQPGR